MDFKNIIVDKEDGVGIVKMNRPAAMNALNTETLQELEKAFAHLGESGDVKVIIITGEEKAFVAGADIAEMKDMSQGQANDFSKFGQSVFNNIAKTEKPVIAAVNGLALRGGC